MDTALVSAHQRGKGNTECMNMYNDLHGRLAMITYRIICGIVWLVCTGDLMGPVESLRPGALAPDQEADESVLEARSWVSRVKVKT